MKSRINIPSVPLRYLVSKLDIKGAEVWIKELYNFFYSEEKEHELRELNRIAINASNDFLYEIHYLSGPGVEGFIFSKIYKHENKWLHIYFNFNNGRLGKFYISQNTNIFEESLLTGHPSDIGFPAKAGILNDIFEETGLNVVDLKEFKDIKSFNNLELLFDAALYVVNYRSGITDFSTILESIKMNLNSLGLEKTIGMVKYKVTSDIHSLIKLMDLVGKIKAKAEPKVIEPEKTLEEEFVEQVILKRVKMSKPLMEEIIHNLEVPCSEDKELYKVNIEQITILNIDSESESNVNDYGIWEWYSIYGHDGEGQGLIIGNHCYIIDHTNSDVWYTNLKEDSRNEYIKIPIHFNYGLFDGLFEMIQNKFRDPKSTIFDLELLVLALVNALSENEDEKFFIGRFPIDNYISKVQEKIDNKMKVEMTKFMRDHNPIGLD